MKRYVSVEADGGRVVDELLVLATLLNQRGGDESVFLKPPLQSDTKRLEGKQS